jgi:hypothetical protein
MNRSLFRILVALMVATLSWTSIAEPAKHKTDLALDSIPMADSDRGWTVTERREWAREWYLALRGLSHQDAALVLTLIDHESKLARYVGNGCKHVPKGKPDCDGGRAATFLQLHPWCRPAHVYPPMSREQVRGAIDCALTRLKVGLDECRSGYKGAFAYYARGCGWTSKHKSQSPAAREATFRKYLEVLR